MKKKKMSSIIHPCDFQIFKILVCLQNANEDILHEFWPYFDSSNQLPLWYFKKFRS